MSAIRVLTVEQSAPISQFRHLFTNHALVRNYHASYYVPHNLCLIVAGKLSSGTSSLLSVIQDKIEPNLIAHGQNQGPRPTGWRRPFVETPSANRPPLPKSLTRTVEFPEQDESVYTPAYQYLVLSSSSNGRVDHQLPWTCTQPIS